MYIATDKMVTNPDIRYITRVFVPELGVDKYIYEIVKKVVDKSMFLDYIENYAIVELKDRTIKVFYKGGA